MSAERDSQQKTTFIYSNFYQLYRQGKMDAQKTQNAAADPIKAKVLRMHTAAPDAPTPAEVQVVSQAQNDVWSKWAHNKPVKTLDDETRQSKFQQIREHLKSLREARQRLKFLSEELDEVLKKS